MASEELLQYYRNRVLELEKSLSESLSLIQSVNLSTDLSSTPIPTEECISDNLRLRKELFNRQEELGFVKQKYREALLSVLDERELLIKTISENDRLKQQELSDRTKIQTLLDLSTPLQYAPPSKTKTGRSLKASQSLLSSIRTSQEVTTCPSAFEVDQTLRIYQDRCEALQQERSGLVDEYENQIGVLKKDYQDLFSYCKSLELTNKDITFKFLTYKHESETKLRMLVEEYDQLRTEYRRTKCEERIVASEVQHKVEASRHEIEESANELLASFRHQLLAKDTQIAKNQVKLETEVTRLKEENIKLKHQLNHYKVECKRADQRRIWAFEGLERDVSSLRKALSKMAKMSLTPEQLSLANQALDSLTSRLSESCPGDSARRLGTPTK
ncbi:hypothetical protein RCL1_006121 [Eukaryota sp. TZLM3-RCL]